MNLYIITLKQLNRRNLYFLIFFIVMALFLNFIFWYEEESRHNNFIAYLGFLDTYFFIWAIVLFSSEIDSGLISKLISNGISRKIVTKQLFLTAIIFSILYYIASYLVLLSLILIDESIAPEVNAFLGIEVFGFLALSIMALFISLFFKKLISAILVGHFLIKNFFGKTFDLLAKFFDLPSLKYFSPIGLAESCTRGIELNNPCLQFIMLLFFIVLFSFLTYWKLSKMNFLS